MIWATAGTLAGIILAVALVCLGHSIYGRVRVPELPGLLFILLAGAQYRRTARQILARRTRGGEDSGHVRQDGARQADMDAAVRGTLSMMTLTQDLATAKRLLGMALAEFNAAHSSTTRKENQR